LHRSWPHSQRNDRPPRGRRQSRRTQSNPGWPFRNGRRGG
jgi:hypothetical protein